MKHLVTIASMLFATTAFAQTPAAADPWTPWLGCWQIADESVEDVQRLLAATPGGAGRQTARNGARVCVTSSSGSGALMTTLVDGKAVASEAIIADGQSRPLADDSCTGTQRAEWSALGPRLYAHTEVQCGDQPRRTISGFSAVVSGPSWIDIQMIESEGRKSMRVRRYRPAADQTGVTTQARSRTMPLGGKLTLAEIKEASAKLAPEAVQAMVLELGQGGYDLNGQRLVELDEAGVHDSVIDLLVAVSFPEKFVVDRAIPVSGPGAWGGLSPPDYGAVGAWGYFSGWGYYAHPMYYSSYYSPFGYQRWGYYDPYYYGSPGIVILNPPGGSGEPASTGEGRVIAGQGYTRIRPNAPEPAIRTGNGGSWGGTSAGSTGGSNSGAGGAVSTGGYSGGGGGGERVAVPRPPGEQ